MSRKSEENIPLLEKKANEDDRISIEKDTLGISHSEQIELCRIRWITAVPMCCLLMLLFGVSYGLAMFSLPIKDRSVVLLSAFTGGLGVQSFCVAVCVLVGGYVLDTYPSRMKTVLLIGLSIVILTISGMIYGLSANHPLLLYWCTAISGFGLGSVYIVGVELAARWMPEAIGIAMGLGMGSIGLGSIFGSQIFSLFVQIMSIEQGFFSGMVLFVAPVLILLPFISFPPPTFNPASVTAAAPPAPSDAVESSNTTSPNHEHEHHSDYAPRLVGRKLGLSLLKQPSLWFLVVLVASLCGPGYGALVSFPSILGVSFSVGQSQAASLFALLQVLGMIARFGAGFCVDYIGFGYGYFSSGAKNMAILMLTLNSLGLFLAPVFQYYGYFQCFFACIVMIYVSFSACSIVAAVLARQIFSPANSSLVFGIAGGLFAGFCTMVFSLLSAGVLSSAQEKARIAAMDSGLDSVVIPSSAFTPYFHICGAFCLLGLFSTLVLPRCAAAFELVSKQGDKIVFIEREEKDLPDLSAILPTLKPEDESEVGSTGHRREESMLSVVGEWLDEFHETFLQDADGLTVNQVIHSDLVPLEQEELEELEQEILMEEKEEAEAAEETFAELAAPAIEASYASSFAMMGGFSMAATHYDAYLVKAAAQEEMNQENNP